MELRELNVKDIFCVARMLGKITKGARVQLASLLTDKTVNPAEVGMVLFQNVFTEAEDDLKAWLSDLIGKPVEEFEKMPPQALIDIIKQLSAQEGIKDFLSQVSQLVTRIPEKS